MFHSLQASLHDLIRLLREAQLPHAEKVEEHTTVVGALPEPGTGIAPEECNRKFASEEKCDLASLAFVCSPQSAASTIRLKPPPTPKSFWDTAVGRSMSSSAVRWTVGDGAQVLHREATPEIATAKEGVANRSRMVACNGGAAESAAVDGASGVASTSGEDEASDMHASSTGLNETTAYASEHAQEQPMPKTNNSSPPVSSSNAVACTASAAVAKSTGSLSDKLIHTGESDVVVGEDNRRISQAYNCPAVNGEQDCKVSENPGLGGQSNMMSANGIGGCAGQPGGGTGQQGSVTPAQGTGTKAVRSLSQGTGGVALVEGEEHNSLFDSGSAMERKNAVRSCGECLAVRSRTV